MIKKTSFLFALLLSCGMSLLAQDKETVIEAIITEANENSQLEALGHELMDGIGPRLVGTPQMKNAHDWAVSKYASWGIPARNEQWGEWKEEHNWPGAQVRRKKVLPRSLLFCQPCPIRRNLPNGCRT